VHSSLKIAQWWLEGQISRKEVENRTENVAAWECLSKFWSPRLKKDLAELENREKSNEEDQRYEKAYVEGDGKWTTSHTSGER